MGTREGLRLRFNNIDDIVRSELLNFSKWLRRDLDFPIRVVVYVKNTKQIKNMEGDYVYGTFFGPFDKSLEPYIRVATGDYFDLIQEIGPVSAIKAILHGFAHEIVHYQQWVMDEDYDERKANYRATRLVNRYFEYKK